MDKGKRCVIQGTNRLRLIGSVRAEQERKRTGLIVVTSSETLEDRLTLSVRPVLSFSLRMTPATLDQFRTMGLQSAALTTDIDRLEKTAQLLRHERRHNYAVERTVFSVQAAG